MKKYLMMLFLLNLFALSGTGQDKALGKNEFTVWGGFSPDSNVLIGKTPDARFGIVAFRYSRR